MSHKHNVALEAQVAGCFRLKQGENNLKGPLKGEIQGCRRRANFDKMLKGKIPCRKMLRMRCVVTKVSDQASIIFLYTRKILML